MNSAIENGNALICRKLLRYFAQQPSCIPIPILHPDRFINRLNEAPQLPATNFRNAAVLIPVINDSIVLTVRTEHLSSHPGQVSFPGGTTEPDDVDSVHTALRESEEEIGLHPEQVHILGVLGNLLMPSGYCVAPVVGTLTPETKFTPSPIEVAHIFHVPLGLALSTGSYQRAWVDYRSSRRETLEMHYEGYRIWGATAAILYHLANELEQMHGEDCHSTHL